MSKIIDYLKEHKIYWISMFVFFSIFSAVILKTIDNSNKKELAKIEEVNRKAELRELNATKQVESAKADFKVTSSKVSNLEKQLIDQNKMLYRMETNYSKSIKELINLKDEKTYIPNNVSTNEQFDFITNYKYTEY